MPITNFDFPGVALKQVFQEATTGTTSTLSVACIGQQYKLHRADYEDEAALIPQTSTAYDPTSGLTVTTLPGRTSGCTLDTDTAFQKLVVKNGQFSYTTASSSTSAFTPTITSSTTIKFSSPVMDGKGKTAYVGFGTRGAKIGDTVVISGTVESTAQTVFAVITAITASGDTTGYDTIQVASMSPITTEATGVSVAFCAEQDDTYAQGTNTFTISSTGTLTIQGGLHSPITELSGSTGTLVKGDLYIEYREKATTYVGKLGSVDNTTDVTQLLGAPCKANPLALAVYAAIVAGNNVTVYFTGVDGQTVANYTEAMDFLEKYQMIYSIVPATEDQAIVKAVLSEVISASENEESKIRRTLWFGITQSSSLTSKEDLIEDIIAKRYVSSYRAQGVWADDLIFNGQTVPCLMAAAAAAGMRAYEPCHRPLSNMEYTLFSVAETHGFTKSQLKQVGSNGIWIIANNDDGTPINMKQITTAMKNNVNVDQQSVVSNADQIALALCHVGQHMVGNSNISDYLISLLSDTIKLIMDSRLANSTSAYIGPQLIDWQLESIYQDTANVDHVYASVSCTPPKPFNKFNMTLRVV